VHEAGKGLAIGVFAWGTNYLVGSAFGAFGAFSVVAVVTVGYVAGRAIKVL
jgi:hypothetical protein